jgi:hypothetical protein
MGLQTEKIGGGVVKDTLQMWEEEEEEGRFVDVTKKLERGAAHRPSWQTPLYE